MTDTRTMVAQRLDRGLRPNVISLLLFITNINCTFALRKSVLSIMQKKTDMGTSLVSKSLPIANSNSVKRLFSARKANSHVSSSERQRYRIRWDDDWLDVRLVEHRGLGIRVGRCLVYKRKN